MSDFLAQITYTAGTSLQFRHDGKKWRFRQGKPERCDSRKTALRCRSTPGFSVRVLAGSLDDPEPPPPEMKKLVPKKMAPKKVAKRKAAKPKKR